MNNAITLSLVPADVAEAAVTISLAPLSHPIFEGCILGAVFFAFIPAAVLDGTRPRSVSDFVIHLGIILLGSLLSVLFVQTELHLAPETAMWLQGILAEDFTSTAVRSLPIAMAVARATDKLRQAWQAGPGRGPSQGEGEV